MEKIINYFSLVGLRDIIDMAIVSVLIYFVLKLIRGTRAEQLSRGILVILILTKISQVLDLYTVNWLLYNLITLGFMAILIVFQPELRRGLEVIGRSSSLRGNFGSNKEKTPETVQEICDAVASLSRQKIGALIVFERKTGLSEIMKTGTEINGLVSSGLLINIFIPNTPLHDGAVIIKGNQLLAAACFLPLSDSVTISKELGTRHRAGIGITEKSDCMSLMVSEETGSISIAENGVISRYLDIETLESILLDIYNPSVNTVTNPLNHWRGFETDEKDKN
ncbi:MAG: diadenylate cyclase CdaA [Tissierellia bacterium]|nr:diadenylate cyclase CdaA [Tissierellia bacterium]